MKTLFSNLLRGKKQIKNPVSGYKVGGLDIDGVKIEKIYSKFDNEMVYRTSSAIRLYIDDGSKKREFYKKNQLNITKELGNIYSILPEDLSKTESINRLIGRAITTNIFGNTDDAKDILYEAELRIISIRTLEGRLAYAASSFASVCLIFLYSRIFHSELTVISLCGALGAAMSVATGFSSISIDLDASRKINCLIGGSRVLIGVLASIFLYFSIKSEIIFTFISKSPGAFGFYMIAMVSGFAEKLVPNIMSNLAKDPSTMEKTPERESNTI